jgi:serine/threonine-protein kinase
VSRDVVAGQRLGPYELVRELGRGGFASVWLAKREGKGGFEASFAVKIARIEIATDPAFQKMFLDEARLAAQINHPNVVNIFELGEENDLLYLVMEYIRGRPLNVLRNQVERAGGKIPVSILMRVLADTCAGLHAAHEVTKNGKSLGVIHRDVSPQNVLVSDKGTIKLIDFGVAKANDRLAAETTAGHTKGKLRYMAPEQAIGKELDRRADIWSVGAVAYDLIEGNTPFDGYNDLVRLFKLLDDSPPPPFTTPVPSAIASLIQRCLQRDPNKRFATAAELRQTIEDALDQSALRVTNDDVAKFFEPWLREDAEEIAPSGRGKLRERLKRPTTGVSMNTIDVPAPEQVVLTPLDSDPALDSKVETLGALNSAIVPTQRWRIPVAAIAVTVLVGGGIGIYRSRVNAEIEVPIAAAASLPPPPPSSARDEPPPPEPASASTPVEAPSVSVPASFPPPRAPVGSAVAAPRPKAHPQRPSKPPPPPGATTTSRRYDDTIQ